MPGPDEPRPYSRYRGPATGLALAGVLAVVVGLVASSVPGLNGHPASLHRQTPLVVPAVVDPVDAMAQLRDGSPHRAAVPELTVRTDRPSSGYLAVAELTDYDGAQWRFEATFAPTGGRVPAPAAAPGPVDNAVVTQEVTLTGNAPVPLLAALDRPRSVTGMPVAADGATGMLLPQAGTTGRRYTVTSQAPVSTLAGLPGADGIDPTPTTPADTAIPPNTSADLATTLRFLAVLSGRRPAPTVAFLQDASAVLRSGEKRMDPAATGAGPGGPGPTTTVPESSYGVGGTSLSAVINAVTVNRAATPEQFATFYAMVARYLGVPARVVTGYRLVGSSGTGALPAGTYQVTNRQAWAWVEIPVTGAGWVVADPTPDATASAAGPPPESVQAPSTTVPAQAPSAVPRNQITGGHAIAPRTRFSPARHGSVPPWVAPAIGIAALLLLAALFGPAQAAARRAWRRRSRRSADPGELAVGAWLEMVDHLHRAGMDVPVGATNSEVVAGAVHHFGAGLAESATAVAVAAEQAVCSTRSPVETEAAARAWEAQRAVGRRVIGQLDRRQRLWALLRVSRSPRSAAATTRPRADGRE